MQNYTDDKQKKRLLRLLLLLLVILMIIMIWLGVSLLSSGKSARPIIHHQPMTASPPAQLVKRAKKIKPEFDFYKVLPKQRAVAASTKASQAQQFMVQVASYQNQQTAQQVRAQLLLLGFNPMVNKRGAAGNVWYRLDIGPFGSRHSAEVVRAKLQSQGINGSMIIPIRNHHG